MTDGKWYKWAWYLSVMEVSEHDSLEAAVAVSRDADEAFVCIEGPDRIIDRDEVWPMWNALSEAERAAAPPQPKFGIKLREPGGGKALAWYGSYHTAEKRDAEAARLRERFGDRVVVGGIPWDYREDWKA